MDSTSYFSLRNSDFSSSSNLFLTPVDEHSQDSSFLTIHSWHNLPSSIILFHLLFTVHSSFQTSRFGFRLMEQTLYWIALFRGASSMDLKRNSPTPAVSSLSEWYQHPSKDPNIMVLCLHPLNLVIYHLPLIIHSRKLLSFSPVFLPLLWCTPASFITWITKPDSKLLIYLPKYCPPV